MGAGYQIGCCHAGLIQQVVIHCSDIFDIIGASLGSFKEKVKQRNKVLTLIIKSEQNRRASLGKTTY